jgi:hypothetical protein
MRNSAIVLTVLLASLLAPGIARAEWSIVCDPGGAPAETSEAAEVICAPPEPLEGEEPEQPEQPEAMSKAPDAPALDRSRPATSGPPVAGRAAPTITPPKKAAACKRASAAAIRAERKHIHALPRGRRRRAELKLARGLCR